jgi:hypothetical protein
VSLITLAFVNHYVPRRCCQHSPFIPFFLPFLTLPALLQAIAVTHANMRARVGEFLRTLDKRLSSL